MAITGTPVFDGLTLIELEANLLNKQLTCKAAFINTRQGATHGYTEGTGAIWSEETRVALRALTDCMERDLARIHLGHTIEGLTPPASVQYPAGLSEHLDGDTTSSI